MSSSEATQITSSTEFPDPPYLGVLLCPACASKNAALCVTEQTLRCDHCKQVFPLLKCSQVLIPWLFEYPQITSQEWQARLNGFLHLNELDQQRYKEGLKDKRISKTGNKRITKLWNAKKQQIEQVQSLLEPLEFDSKAGQALKDIIANYQSKTPKVQGLDSYYNNIFRDWAWNNGENEQMLAALEAVIDENFPIGKALTIGAGAGRLSYDLHQKYSADYSLLLDINPLLLFSACRVIQGESFSLNEFPIAPLNKESFFKEQTCEAPVESSENIHFLFADGMNPPVKENSFDTVLTPWLLDIIPQNLREYIPRINQCLEVGGTWLNIGSLAFFHSKQSWCYSEEEVVELIEKNGFELVKKERSTLQYMKSPLSANGRTETVFSFNARKVKHVAVPPKFDYLPNWIASTSKPIPKNYEQEIDSSKHLLQAQVLAAIDGIRNVEQIGELVAKQYNLGVGEATHAVRQILLDHFEDN